MGIEEKQDKVIRVSDILVKLILFILLLLLFFQLYICYSGNYNINIFGISFNFKFVMDHLETIQGIQVFIGTILIVTIRFISKIYIDKLDSDYLKNYLHSIDEDAILYLDSSTEMIYRNFEDEYSIKVRSEGCIRIKYEYKLEIPKYKCKVKRYYIQESKLYRTTDHNGRRRRHYRFDTIDSVIEYTFKTLDNNKYYPMLYHILSKKTIDVSVNDTTVIIKLHLKDNISIFDAIDKIEELYLEIIKIIGEENTNK